MDIHDVPRVPPPEFDWYYVVLDPPGIPGYPTANTVKFPWLPGVPFNVASLANAVREHVGCPGRLVRQDQYAFTYHKRPPCPE